MDLDSYISRYSGETRLQRLLLIAQRTPDEAVAAKAFSLAEAQMKHNGNVRRYKDAFGNAITPSSSGEEADSSDRRQRRPPPSSFYFDEEWILATESSNREARHVLQGRLSSAQSHLHKEAIRNAYVALAKHDAKTGELREALSSLLRAMDYCTSRSQTAQISLLVLEVAFGMERYQQAREYVTKMEHTLTNVSTIAPAAASSTSPTAAASPGRTDPAANALQDVSIKLKIAFGMERMAQGDYESAANTFTQLCMTNRGSAKMDWPGVASAEDIALYTSLLSLATQSRSQILELAEHPEALEMFPAMKELLLQWSRANYVKCIEAFSEDATNTILPFPDLYFRGERWDKLCQKIREKGLLEYLRPYQCVELSNMGKLFPSIPNLQDTLVDLMGRGLLLNAKIDARANILYKTTINKPTVDLSGMEQRVLEDTHALLIRLACLEHDLCVSDGLGHPNSNRARRTAARYGRDVAHHMDDDDDSSDEDTPMLDVDVEGMNARNPEDMY